MTTEQFYQIASCASIIQDLADKGAEYSNAVRNSLKNCKFEDENGRHSNAYEFSEIAKVYENAKAKIEERIKAKNEELQKLINQ